MSLLFLLFVIYFLCRYDLHELSYTTYLVKENINNPWFCLFIDKPWIYLYLYGLCHFLLSNPYKGYFRNFENLFVPGFALFVMLMFGTLICLVPTNCFATHGIQEEYMQNFDTFNTLVCSLIICEWFCYKFWVYLNFCVEAPTLLSLYLGISIISIIRYWHHMVDVIMVLEHTVTCLHLVSIIHLNCSD